MSLETFQAMKYGPIGEAIIRAEPHTEADPVGVYAAVLALWSGAIQGTVTMADGRPVVVWTVLAGDSALGRKGTAKRVATRMLSHSIGKFLDTHIKGGVSSGPSLTQLLYERQEETEGTEGGTDTRTIVVDDEWSENLRKQNTCATFASRLRKCWDGETLHHTTMRISMVVESPRLGFHAHITPDNWTEYIKPRDAKGGSYNRLLPVLVEGDKVLPYGHREVYPEIKGLTEAYEWARKTPRFMSLSDKAARRFDELREQFLVKMASMPSHLTCYVQRTPEQVIRVAAVLAATECKTTVSREAIDAAWAFVQYSTKSVERLVREDAKVSGKVVKPLPELIREILTRYEGEVPHSNMLRCLGVRATAASLRKAVASMSDVKVVTGVTSGKGRPGVVYEWADPKEEEPATEEAETPTPAPVVIPEQKTESDAFTLSGSWL